MFYAIVAAKKYFSIRVFDKHVTKLNDTHLYQLVSVIITYSVARANIIWKKLQLYATPSSSLSQTLLPLSPPSRLPLSPAIGIYPSFPNGRGRKEKYGESRSLYQSCARAYEQRSKKQQATEKRDLKLHSYTCKHSISDVSLTDAASIGVTNRFKDSNEQYFINCYFFKGFLCI